MVGEEERARQLRRLLTTTFCACVVARIVEVEAEKVVRRAVPAEAQERVRVCAAGTTRGALKRSRRLGSITGLTVVSSIRRDTRL